MPQVVLPTLREGETIEQKILYLTDNIYKLRKELSFLLGNLDSDNVIEAQSVIADWVYAGTVKANQLIIGGENGSISFEDLSNKPVIPVLPSYIKSTYIDSTTVQSPTIVGGTLTGGLIRTSIPGAERLELSGNGFVGYGSNNKKNGVAIETGIFGFSALRFFWDDGQISSIFHDTYNEMRVTGTWNFSGATVTGINAQVDYGIVTNIAMSVAQAYIDAHVMAYH